VASIESNGAGTKSVDTTESGRIVISLHNPDLLFVLFPEDLRRDISNSKEKVCFSPPLSLLK